MSARKKEKKEKKAINQNTIEKTINTHKEVHGIKKRTFYVSMDAGDVMIESSMDDDTPEKLMMYTLSLIDETRRSKGDLKYVT